MRGLVVSLVLFLPGLSLSDDTGGRVFPLTGSTISSHFGTRADPFIDIPRHHNGVDLPAPIGTPVRAIMGGDVIFRDYLDGFGNLVTLKHSNGLTSHYGHLKNVHAALGHKVRAGQIIGSVGTSGRATGSHLHFEVRLHGRPEDPLKYLPSLGIKAAG